MRMAKRLDFGCVWINTHIPIVAEMPHGGFKRSGYGKDLSMYGFEDYTRDQARHGQHRADAYDPPTTAGERRGGNDVARGRTLAESAHDVVIVLDACPQGVRDLRRRRTGRLRRSQRGEFFSLLGPSGCGKTTLLKMIAGFERPTSGQVLLEGVDVSDVPPHQRNVNTVFQQYALFPHMSVYDNVAFGLRAKKVPAAETRRRALEMLEVVRLGEFANRRPAQLSGGQQQRVALARALVNLPSALLLDEPLAALDLKLREAMQLELKRIQREVGITFIFVTHDQGEALTMSDRIAVMSRGRVEQIGTPQEIYDAPASIFVAGFIGSANLLPGTLEAVDGGTARRAPRQREARRGRRRRPTPAPATRSR